MTAVTSGYSAKRFPIWMILSQLATDSQQWYFTLFMILGRKDTLRACERETHFVCACKWTQRSYTHNNAVVIKFWAGSKAGAQLRYIAWDSRHADKKELCWGDIYKQKVARCATASRQVVTLVDNWSKLQNLVSPDNLCCPGWIAKYRLKAMLVKSSVLGSRIVFSRKRTHCNKSEWDPRSI